MRLIDADALAKKCCIGIEEFGTCEKCLEYYARKGGDRICYLEYPGEDVRNAPTIDAIPVEWLEAHETEYIDDWGYEPVSIGMALNMWQKEQEAQE